MRPEPSPLDSILVDGSVDTVFQPIFELDSQLVAGFEALTRGPVGPLREPTALLDAASEAGRVPEVDWLCRVNAIESARAAGVRSPLSLLINVEPETLHADRAQPSRWGEFADLRCYCEITERALERTPGDLVAAIDQIRAQDWGVALDDVGVNPASLALLPLLQPDLIKLDLRLLHDGPSGPLDVEVARVVAAALTQAATTGAAVIAEGIETEWHLELARAYGVRYGQGYLLGEPGPLPDPLPTPLTSMPLVPRVFDRGIEPGPFTAVAGSTSMRRLSPDAVSEVARQLLAQAMSLVPSPVVLVSSPSPLRPDLHEIVANLLEGPVATVAGVLGAPQPPLPVTALADGDPAARDFAVAVTSVHFAAAVVARPTTAGDGYFDAALVLDRGLAIAVGNALLTRL